MRVLITGGAGFLGAWIIRRLGGSKAELRVFDIHSDRRLVNEIAGRKITGSLDWREGDIADPASVSDAARGCDAVVHLAGLLTPDCADDPVRGARVNVLGTLNVFEAARRHGIDRVIYSSSGAVFGPGDLAGPFPATHYGAFKLANEGSARAYLAGAGISSIGIRPFVVYGPGRDGGLTAGPTLACRAAARGERYVIPLTGRAGLVFVDDVAAAFAAGVTAPFRGAHTLNLPGTVASMEDVVAAITRVVPDARIRCDGPGMPSSAQAENEFSNGLLPLGKERTLDQGIALTIDFYRHSLG